MPPQVTHSTSPQIPRAVRYQDWSIEELRRLAIQLQLANAGRKSRKELLECLVGGSKKGGFQNLEFRRRAGSPGHR
jgi:hypothetical protein